MIFDKPCGVVQSLLAHKAGSFMTRQGLVG